VFKRIIKYCLKHFGLFEKLAYVTDRRIKPQIKTIKILSAIVFIHISNLGSLNSFSQNKSVGKLPSVSTIARVAGSVSLEGIREAGSHAYKIARAKKMIEPYMGKYVAIVDGHELTVSDYCKCSHCRRRKLKTKDGSIKYQYYHSFTALILAGEKYSFVLDIEPIAPGESEISSAYRLIERVCQNYPRAFKVLIGDALYLNAKIFKLLESRHKKAIAVLKEERRQLFEEANRLLLLSKPEVYQDRKTIYKIWDHAIGGCWDGRAPRGCIEDEGLAPRSRFTGNRLQTA